MPLGRLPAAFFVEDSWVTRTVDRKLMVTLNKKSGLLGVHDVPSGKHLRDIPFGKWGRGTRAPVELTDWSTWDMHPWRHELAISLGADNDPERAIVRILDLDRGTVQAELVADPRLRTNRWGGVSWHPDGRTLAVSYGYKVLSGTCRAVRISTPSPTTRGAVCRSTSPVPVSSCPLSRGGRAGSSSGTHTPGNCC